MERLRLASYNVEWFNALFDDRGRMLADMEPSARFRISRADQLGALGIVFTALDADGVMIIEAPDTNIRRSTVTALENFARHFGLRTRKAIIGYPSETEQEIAFLYDPDKLTAIHDPEGEPAPSHGAPGAPRFDSTLRLDLDGDGQEDIVRFSKPPLELKIATAGGRTCALSGFMRNPKRRTAIPRPRNSTASPSKIAASSLPNVCGCAPALTGFCPRRDILW